MSGICRVIVGASGSPGSLQALRFAEELARAHDAILMPVLAWVPPGGDLADRRAPCGYLRRVWAEDACQRLRDALHAVWGEIPVDPLLVQPVGSAVPANSAPTVGARLISPPDVSAM